MLKNLKNFVKSKPILYDLINAKLPYKTPTERWLNLYSQKKNGDVVFIQIGANDGLRWDPVRRFIVRDKWKGILVEPLPAVYQMLKKNYYYLGNKNLIFVNAAISDRDEGEVNIWAISGELLNSLSIEDQLYYLRKSSLKKDFVMNAVSKFNYEATNVECHKVKCLSINKLIKECWDGPDVDLIVCDAEGHDDVIIGAIDFTKLHPEAILFESHNLGERKEYLRDLLARNNYSLHDLGGDSIALCNR